MSIFSFEIPNWDKYQARHDRTNFAWFKFYSDFFTDAKVAELSDRGKVLFTYALSVRNAKRAPLCEINIRVTCSLLSWTPEYLSAAFNELARLGLIRLPKAGIRTRKRNQMTADAHQMTADAHQMTADGGLYVLDLEERTNTCLPTQDVEQTRVSDFDFKKLREAYPKRAPRQPVNWPEAEKKLRPVIKTPEDFAAMLSAIENFSRVAHATGIYGTAFVPMASTWVNQKRYLEFSESNATAAPEQPATDPMTGEEFYLSERQDSA